MKTTLGLDIGSSSVGWAVVEDDETILEVKDAGVRIVPLSTDDATEFTHGNDMSKCKKRTLKRTQRKGYDRYQQRRSELTRRLLSLDMFPDENLLHAPQQTLWKLRSDAASRQLSLKEIGRVLYHINQKRGYKSSKSETASDDKKQKDYVMTINNRYGDLKASGQTIGEYFYSELQADHAFRCKERIYPRKAYIEEYDKIMHCQQAFYPNVLTDEVIAQIRDEVIFYQRKLKSCKHLVALCDLEKRPYERNGRTIYIGPKVAPRTSPLFQVCKMWESINNLVLKNRFNDELAITLEQKQGLFDIMNTHGALKLTDLYEKLNISKADGWWGGKAIGKGLQGNTTRMVLQKALDKLPQSEVDALLKFDLKYEDKAVDMESGELTSVVSEEFEKEPLYRLWHIVYSINDKDEMRNALRQQFNITDETIVDNLYAIDFVKAGYGNKSTKAIRRLLPYLQAGCNYYDALRMVGYERNNLTKEELSAKPLSNSLKQLQKNELRQPVVEKILNQMINVVNALMQQHGRFDEIRVELARELKQSKDERNATFKAMNENERKNDAIAKQIAEYGLTPTRSRIQKYKMWQESEHLCFYCGQPVNVVDFLKGYNVEVEHVIPKTLFFDDSFSNKVCACKKCNSDKGQMTAYDFMESKGEAVFNDYVERVNSFYKAHKISKTKCDRLLTTYSKIPTDFIDRQLRESQYIAVKAKEILGAVCHNITSTSGSVTDFLRHTWGYDNVLHDLNFARYQMAGLVETKQIEHNGNIYEEERIKDWNKRLDHRHHAIDAITIACTKQGYIQRLNNLQTLKDVKFAPVEQQGEEQRNRHTQLERYILEQPHPTTADVAKIAERILVSFKSGKKVTTPGKRFVYKGGKRILAQTGLDIPRGALSEESVYGRINRYVKGKKGTRVNQQYVIKYKVGYGIGYMFNGKETQEKVEKVLSSCVDKAIAELLRNRAIECNYQVKEMFVKPILFNGLPVKSVRCFTGLSAVVPVAKNASGENIGFVKPGNNHHIAIYVNRDGKRVEHVVTFWSAVERKKYGLPVIITNPKALWEGIEDKQLPDSFLESLPMPDWTYEISLQQNEMFILGMEEDEYQNAMKQWDYKLLNKYMYKVQNIAESTYRFCLHTVAQFDIKKVNKPDARFYNVGSVDAFFRLNPHKVKIDLLGRLCAK